MAVTNTCPMEFTHAGGALNSCVAHALWLAFEGAAPTVCALWVHDFSVFWPKKKTKYGGAPCAVPALCEKSAVFHHW